MDFTKLQSATVYLNQQHYELTDFLHDINVLAVRENDYFTITCQSGNIYSSVSPGSRYQNQSTSDHVFSHLQYQYVSVSTWYCKSSGKIMDSYEDQFTGENINCIAKPTTSVIGKGKVNLINLI